MTNSGPGEYKEEGWGGGGIPYFGTNITYFIFFAEKGCPFGNLCMFNVLNFFQRTLDGCGGSSEMIRTQRHLSYIQTLLWELFMGTLYFSLQ